MSDEAAEPAIAPPARDPRWWLPWAGLVVGIWATLPQYSGPALNTDATTEIVDHIFPGILVLLVAVVALVSGRSGTRTGGRTTMVPFLCGTAVLLAGFWMIATHVPLIAEALTDKAPWDATIYHSSSALATFGLGLMWVVAHWQDLAVIEAEQAREKAEAAPEPDAS